MIKKLEKTTKVSIYIDWSELQPVIMQYLKEKYSLEICATPQDIHTRVLIGAYRTSAKPVAVKISYKEIENCKGVKWIIPFERG